MTIHISWTQTHDRNASIKFCPDCKKRSVFVSFFQEWYGWDTTCLRCGRNWIDGEWQDLDFYRYARRDSKQAARSRWKRGIQKGNYDNI